MPKLSTPVPLAAIESRIYLIRGNKIMLDADLAQLYGVPMKALNQAVKRNRERFPDEFTFQLTSEEAAALRSQSVTLAAAIRELMTPPAKPRRQIGFLTQPEEPGPAA